MTNLVMDHRRNLKVGSSVWRISVHSRQFMLTGQPRDKIFPMVVIGENRHSWLVAVFPGTFIPAYKLSKKTLQTRENPRRREAGGPPQFLFSSQEVEDFIYVQTYKPIIVDAVRMCGTASCLRQIADILHVEDETQGRIR